MQARLLPMGAAAVLLEVSDIDAALALRAHLAVLVDRGDGAFGAVDDLVLGARTVLVTLADAGRLVQVARECLDAASAVDPAAASAASAVDDADAAAGEVVEVAVRYDGPDLDEVARLTGLTREQVVEAHTGRTWRVGFGGFAPGFAYLVDGDPRLQVPRRSEPRTRVPAGSVGLAGEFSGIYPRDSPGGWQLIGTTDAVLWAVDREPPALLAPGIRVRFVRDEAQASASTALPTTQPTAARYSAPRTAPALEVLATGPLTLVQDLGRPGLAGMGVGRSGAADPTAYLLGLRLVGHLLDAAHPPPAAAAPASLEVTLGGLRVRAHGDLLVALTGAQCPAAVDGRPVPHAAPVAVADGQVLSLGAPAAGLRTWLAVRGGVAVAPVLASRSTDTLAQLGPPAPAVGDVLPVGPPPAAFPLVEVAPQQPPAGGEVVLLVEPGPRADWCDLTSLEDAAWTVSSRSNRVGIRLEGKSIRRNSEYAERELPSEGLVAGAVQVPAGGDPVVFLADHPVTGGYPVVAVLTTASLARAAQLRPGQPVRLRWVRSRR